MRLQCMVPPTSCGPVPDLRVSLVGPIFLQRCITGWFELCCPPHFILEGISVFYVLCSEVSSARCSFTSSIALPSGCGLMLTAKAFPPPPCPCSPHLGAWLPCLRCTAALRDTRCPLRRWHCPLSFSRCPHLPDAAR